MPLTSYVTSDVIKSYIFQWLIGEVRSLGGDGAFVKTCKDDKDALEKGMAVFEMLYQSKT